MSSRAIAKGNRRRRKLQHSSVTKAAADVYARLLAVNILAHPGVISPHGGTGILRITLTVEKSRFRVTVSKSGTQELLIYGKVDQSKVESILREFVGARLVIR